jgi:predicted phosphoadenosine phosphosulfate sulfurtransferase
MAKASPTLNAISLKHKFEDLAILWIFQDGTPWRAARIDGEFEVSIEPNGDWSISDVWVAVDNGKVGAAAKGSLINLSADLDERIYLAVLDALDGQYSTRIQEWIADELDERNLKIAA